MRSTPVRKALLKILSKDQAPLSAFDILAKLHAQKLLANKTTVYRQLDSLEKQGLIHTVRLSDRSVRYELAGKDDHHHHLVCVKCNDVKDVDFENHLSRQEKNIEKSKKFKILRHSMEFFGLCFNCQ
ncbi:MAG: Fe2+/Zn2+ uptake regulation protein [Parcubacteria group bacterium Gr01-1014_13]|nr:MAG: Fe2+/Zn2+ uptake regulation protein [Parcubacteria group bacterium Gr01-1014_13]